MNIHNKFKIVDDVVFSYREDFCYIGKKGRKEALQLRKPAIMVWQGIEQNHSVSEIVEYFKAVGIEDGLDVCEAVIVQLVENELIEEKKELVNYISRPFEYSEYLAKPVYISKMSLILTDKCNFKCRHCYNTGYYKKVARTLSVDDWKDVIDAAIKMGCIQFQITGGEPFLYENIFEVLDYIERKGAFFNINTNGSLIDKKAIAKLAKYKKLTEISISLYGLTTETYYNMCCNKFEPEYLLRKYKEMLKCDIPVHLKYVVTSVNYSDLLKISEYEERHNVTIVKMLGYIFPYLKEKTGNGMNLTAEQIKFLHGEGINALQGDNSCRECSMERCSVNFMGAVSLCELLQDITVGNILDEPLEKIWTQKRFEKKVCCMYNEDTPCYSCELKDMCTRCNGISYNTTGTLNGCSEEFKAFTKACAEAR